MESCYEEKETNDCTEIIEENQKINESKVIIKEKEENSCKNSVNSTSTISTTNTVISINTNNPINTIETNNSFNSNIIKNLASITCPNCNFDILYNKIKEDIINGVNIKCSNCSQYFYSSKCPKCKEYFKIDEFIHEGELITCQKCNNQYLQTSCIIKNCEEHFYFVKPKNYTNLPNGIIHDHKKQLVFQKISCYFCLRPIDFITREQNDINRYYEAQKVKCPYEECGKEFNRIICPKCTAVNIVDLGLFIFGRRIKCINCLYVFSKIYCSHCLRLNPLEKSEFKYGEFQCRFSGCSKTSHIANCLHCQAINYFKITEGQFLIQGQPIKCANCEDIFQSVICPGCHHLNPFPEGDFIFGKLYKCKFKGICNKKFMVLVCGNCRSFSVASEEIEGKKYTCVKCKTLLSNFGCPFCKQSILDTNSSYEKGQIMRCPYCEKEFSFCRCYDCRKLIYYKRKSSILGKVVTCECGKKSVNIICPTCKIRISISDLVNDLENGEKINCPSCNKDFEYKENEELNKKENIYYKNLKCIETLKGLKFDFGHGAIDENYLEKQKIFDIDNKSFNKGSSNILQNESDCFMKSISDLSKSSIQMKNKLCIVCQCYEKESIFYPCGHRCTCYKCAVYYFEVYKKCPRCQEDAKGIIPKIYYT